MFSVHTSPIYSNIPVRPDRVTEEDDAKHTPSGGADGEEKQKKAVVLWMTEVREDAQVLKHEGDLDEVDGELVEEVLGEDELASRQKGKTRWERIAYLQHVRKAVQCSLLVFGRSHVEIVLWQFLSMLRPQSSVEVNSPAPTTAVMPIDIS